MMIQPPVRQVGTWRFVILILFLVMGAGDVRGQEEVRARFSADRGSPLIGEPVRLTLIVEAPAEAEMTLPEFPLDWPPFMVTGVGEVQVKTDSDQTTYQQDVVVMLWQPGDYETPETFVEYRLPNSTETFRLAVEPAFFVVSSVLNPNDLTLRPLQPPESLPYVSPLLMVTAFGIVVASVMVLGRWFWKRRLARPKAEASGDTTTRTLRELQRIGTLTLPPFRAYPMVGDMLRKYVEEQFRIPAEEMTTDELLAALQSLPAFNDQQRRDLRRILERVDLVKFAQYQPETDSTKRLLQAVTRWVEQAAPEEAEGEP